jgi:hypothetical protein
MTVMLPTTPEVSVVCDEMDNAITAFLDARNTIPTLGRWESEVEALNLFYLGIRYVEAVITLARTDLILLAPAAMVARGALESTVKAMWMVSADDPFERECRWLVHLRAEERFWTRTSELEGKVGRPNASAMARASSIREFSDAVAAKIPARTQRIVRNPSVQEMLMSVQQPDMYSTYIHLSQFAHSEHAATWLFRAGGLGTAKQAGECVAVEHWRLPLRVCWLSVGRSGRALLNRLGGDGDFLSDADQTRIAAAIEDIGEIRA